MGRIRVLPKILANQIAAGEVVERPCSVVKELMENAIDSGCTEILCEVKSAGKTLIRVRDNGCGIERDDLPLALSPHATSKIYSAEDLCRIKTLGFRGEALASIASVSRLSLISKARGSDSAYSLEVEGEELNPVIAPSAHPDGTTVDVCDLFFNTPARRRFLKSDRTELLRIRDTFVRTALSHPKLGFELISDSKRVLKVGPSPDGIIDVRRIRTLIGADFSVNGISVICEDPRLCVRGVLLPPPLEEQALAEQIYLFLNGRAIADRVVTHALKEGFFEVVRKTLPVRAVLYLEMDPREVDVNVHPRKDEVRFHEVSAIHDLICSCVVDALKRAGVGEYGSGECAKGYDDEVKSADLFESLELQPEADAGDKGENGIFMSARKADSGSFVKECASPHASVYDIDDSSLPSFPENVSGIIDLAAVEDRSGPVIVRKESSSSQAMYQSLLSDRDSVSKNIGLYRASVAAGNVVSGALSAPEKSHFEIPAYENGIEYIGGILDNCAFVRYRGEYYLVKLSYLRDRLLRRSYLYAQASGTLRKKSLKLPFAVKKPADKIRELKECAHLLSRLGFDFTFRKTVMELVAIPDFIRGSDLALLCSRLSDYVLENAASLGAGECPECILSLISANSMLSDEISDDRVLLSSVIDFEELKSSGAVRAVDLKALARDFGV